MALSRCSDNISHASIPLCPFLKILHVLGHIALLDAVFPYWDLRLVKRERERERERERQREVTPLPTGKSLRRVKASTKLSGFTCCLLVALATRKHIYFPDICDATGGSAIIPPTPSLYFHKNSIFLYFLLKSAVSAVLKLTSAVIAIAHVRSVSMKSLSVKIMLFE